LMATVTVPWIVATMISASNPYLRAKGQRLLTR
jgi:hypothetical protein